VDFLAMEEIIKVIEREQTTHQDFSKMSSIDTSLIEN
jgi:hypothetical protein